MSSCCAELSVEFGVVGLLLPLAFVGIVLKPRGLHLSPDRLKETAKMEKQVEVGKH